MKKIRKRSSTPVILSRQFLSPVRTFKTIKTPQKNKFEKRNLEFLKNLSLEQKFMKIDQEELMPNKKRIFFEKNFNKLNKYNFDETKISEKKKNVTFLRRVNSSFLKNSATPQQLKHNQSLRLTKNSKIHIEKNKDFEDFVKKTENPRLKRKILMPQTKIPESKKNISKILTRIQIKNQREINRNKFLKQNLERNLKFLENSEKKTKRLKNDLVKEENILKKARISELEEEIGEIERQTKKQQKIQKIQNKKNKIKKRENRNTKKEEPKGDDYNDIFKNNEDNQQNDEEVQMGEINFQSKEDLNEKNEIFDEKMENLEIGEGKLVFNAKEENDGSLKELEEIERILHEKHEKLLKEGILSHKEDFNYLKDL